MIFTSCAGPDNSDTSSDSNDSTNAAAQTINTTVKPKNTISFNTKTVLDESITSDIFKDYKITMINIWATWCGPCIAEMPELSKLYDVLPEGSNLIGFSIDAGDDANSKQSAQNIISQYNLKYKNVIPDDNIANYVNKNINGIPTSIFVDKDGNVIGDPVIGAPRGDVVEGYKKAIEDRISMLK